MKFFYILANQFLTILLSANTLTTLHFNEKIKYCDVGVSKDSLAIKYRRSKTSVSLAPFTKIDSNMTCFMDSGKIYVFNLSWSKDRYHKNIVINDVVAKSGGGKLILENAKFKLFDNGRSYFIENKLKKAISVNELPVKNSAVISKWSPIVVNGVEYRL